MTAIPHVSPTGPSLQPGSLINQLIDAVNNATGNGTPTAGTFTTVTASSTLGVTGATTLSGGLTTSGARTATRTVVAAAGATQGTATAIAAGASTVVVTVTASTEGVKLPTVATGLQVTVIADTAVGVKVYPAAAGQSIGTATTATTAYALVKNTVTVFYGTSTAKWRVLKGG